MKIDTRKKILTAVFIILFLFTMPVETRADNAYAIEKSDHPTLRPNVLILNSYSQGFPWTADQNDGIIETLKGRYRNCSLFVENMDWKNYPYNENLQFLKEYYGYKYHNKKIDIIITTDDVALNFALENRRELFSDAPIVFSGINQQRVDEIKDEYSNITGILEVIDPRETIQMALHINPKLKNIYVVYDNSESGRSTGQLVTEQINEMNLNLNTVSLNELSFDHLLEVVRDITDESIILITTYYGDGLGKIVEHDFATAEISKISKVPVYHLYDFGMNSGAIGGDMLSGYLNGVGAARIVLRIIGGEKADTIPIESDKSHTSSKIFDYHQLVRFGISPKQISGEYKIVNQPFSFFETYKILALIVLAAFSVLLLFILILLGYMKKIRRMRREILERNEELTQTYEELVASDEELRIQLDEVSLVKRSLEISEEKHVYLALHDILTGLPNRRSLYEDSKSLLKKQTKGITAFLFIDMDNFKYINDSMGHDFGDRLIIKVSEKLSMFLNPGRRLYRLGGDEFIILLPGVSDTREAGKFADGIIQSFKEEILVQNSSLHVSISIGISVFPEHGENVEELLKCADIAMYKAKELGRNRHVVYDKLLNNVFTERMIIERYLYTAMENNEFEIHYQPQLDLRSNRITGFEALLRWNSAKLGYVSPMKFIQIAEDTHIIIPLGEWVLAEACGFISQLHKRGYNDLMISVNISTIQLLQVDFADRVVDILDKLGLEHRYLELEITETTLIESFDVVEKRLQILRDQGIGIALDDFGKGYSSLNYLRQLPISTLKIDKCFIDDVLNNAENETITQYIIKMGRAMGLSIVAEGVELQEQFDFLKRYECDKIQGYLFSKPLSRRDTEKFISSHFGASEVSG